jgi:hypothetical protein
MKCSVLNGLGLTGASSSAGWLLAWLNLTTLTHVQHIRPQVPKHQGKHVLTCNVWFPVKSERQRLQKTSAGSVLNTLSTQGYILDPALKGIAGHALH